MKLPSLRVILDASRETLSRFPLVLLVALIGTISAVLLTEGKAPTTPFESVLIRLLMTCALGLPMFMALAMIAEKQGRKLVLNGIGILFLILYFILLPAQPALAPTGFLVVFVALLAGFHLLVAIAPFMKRDEISAFWEYNKTLLLRLLLSLFYAHVLWVGLSVALLAIDQLFGVEVKGERYGELWMVLAGVFNTWFFLSGVPRQVSALDAQKEFPKGLKVFTQYVMLPLVIIYLVILYAYSVKILIDWTWPKGWVSYLVLGFSITGIFSLLLVHPIAEREENKFIRLFTRNYYRVLAPLAILLFLAIWRRISEYGITERRYYVLLVSFWLAGVIIYFIVSKVRSIKVIPASLCVIAFLSTFGPWSALSVSSQSQMGRLEGFLAKHGILVEGKIVRAEKEIPFEDATHISSIVRHFTEVQGVEALQRWFTVSLDSVWRGSRGETERGGSAERIVGLMGVRYVNERESAVEGFRNFTAVRRHGVPVGGYELFVPLEGFGYEDLTVPFEIAGKRWEMRYRLLSRAISFGGAERLGDSVVCDLDAFARGLIESQRHAPSDQNVPVDQMTLEGGGKGVRFRLVFGNINCVVRGDSVAFKFGRGNLLVGVTMP